MDLYADALARLGATQSFDYVNFNNPLTMVEDLLIFNKAELLL